jgi:hypothetical protein
MASTITNLINTINVAFPVAGQDNDSEGFRTNFNIIQQSLLATESEIETIQNTVNSLGNTVYTTATHLVALQDVKIGTDVISVDPNYNLIVTANGKSGAIVMRPTTVTAYGAYALTDSVTSITTGTFAVDNVRNIQVGATLTFPGVAGLRTVTVVDPASNYITVTPQFSDVPAPFAVGDALVFQNPFFNSSQEVGDLYVQGSIFATGNITAFYGAPSDSRLKENVRTIENALDKVKQISGVFYDWTAEAQPAGLPKEDTGVIAQDVQKVLPEVITTNTEGYLGVRYEKLAGLIIEAIKELSEQVEDIKKKLP